MTDDDKSRWRLAGMVEHCQGCFLKAVGNSESNDSKEVDKMVGHDGQRVGARLAHINLTPCAQRT